MAWSHARISFSFVPVNSGCTRSFGNKTIPRRSTCMLPFDFAPKPKMISAPYPCQFLRLRSQDFSSECFHTLDNTTRLTSAHWHASLWSTSPFPPCSHAALPQRVRTETLFSAVRRRKDLKFALQFSKIPSRKVSGLGCLVLQGFSSLYHKYPFLGFWSVARIPCRKVFSLGLTPHAQWGLQEIFMLKF